MAQYDFAGGDADFKDVYVGLKKLPGVGTLKVGHFKEAFGLEELTSSKYITFIERSLPTEAFAPSRFNPPTRNKIARNALSSWTQSGHLEGRRPKVRRHPVVTTANTAYALLLGYLSGSRGPMLFSTFWTGLLDAPTEELHAMTAEASKREWLDYRRLGTVVEVSFNGLLTQREKEALHG